MMEETVSGFVSGADALRRARDGGRRDAAPVASRAPDDARSTERRTCMTGMSMTVFIPLMPRTVVSVMVPGKSTDQSALAGEKAERGASGYRARLEGRGRDFRFAAARREGKCRLRAGVRVVAGRAAG